MTPTDSITAAIQSARRRGMTPVVVEVSHALSSVLPSVIEGVAVTPSDGETGATIVATDPCCKPPKLIPVVLELV